MAEKNEQHTEETAEHTFDDNTDTGHTESTEETQETAADGSSSDDISEEVEAIGDEIDVDEDQISHEAKQSIEKLKRKLAESRREKQQYMDGMQRAQAELINSRKLHRDQQQREAERATESLLSELLRVMDSFDAAFADTDAWQRVDSQWRIGVEHIYNQFLSVLSESGVEPIEVQVGDQFDPNTQEPVETVPTQDTEADNTIVDQIQRGWRRGERVIRPARVRVYQHQTEQGSE